MACFFQTLKETAARPGEALRMLWQDLDLGNRKLSINYPEKGSNPRVIPISDKLLNMLLALRASNQTAKRIFPYKSTDAAGRSFRKMRQRAARKLGNPELLKIYFYTCRYWRATFEYHKTRDFGAVMYLLGHNSLKYVLLYAQLDKAYFGGNIEYICKEAFTREEAMKLIEAGFEYVLTDKEGVSLFRKIK
jgi:integrase